MNDYESILRNAIKKYGEVSQIQMMFEEMSELQNALCKHLRGYTEFPNICEEIADVQIMLDQMTILFNAEMQVERAVMLKTERLKERLKHI